MKRHEKIPCSKSIDHPTADDLILAANRGLYTPESEHESCGVGLIASIDGKPRRDVIEAGISALKSVWHRGALDADGKTGDGAGIHIEISQSFFKSHVSESGLTPKEARLAVGMVFLPKTDFGAQETCRSIVESEILKFGHGIYGWRQVPTDSSVIGEKANYTRPEIEQIMICNESDVDEDQFESDLYIVRRRIEQQVLDKHITDFYICSLSCRSIIYKGMFVAEQLTAFYPDLLDERFVSSFAVIHQRYSTNTFPTWRAAQPFRMAAHNGEINTIKGNTNWIRSHGTRASSKVFEKDNTDIFPLIEPGASDSMALDLVLESLVRAGRPLPVAQCLMIPDSWSKKPNIPKKLQELYSYCNCVMEPWDGPAAIAAADGIWAIAAMDRNGLRPMRYSVTSNGLLVAGSETGMVHIDEEDIIAKGRLGPGEMIGVNLFEGKVYYNKALKEWLANRNPYGEWEKKIVKLGSLIKSDKEPINFSLEELRQRQRLAGWSMEDLEMILHPMAEEGKEAVGSMGDDTPLAVLSKKYRGLHHFFRQSFSQVTNPPIDSLREYSVMSLKTRLGNLGNIFDESEEQTNLLQLDSPILTNAEFFEMREYMGENVKWIDCTFEATSGHGELTQAIENIRREAEDAVRGGAIHLILSDENVSKQRAAVPMILAAGSVHSHLVSQRLRTFTSINVRSAECMDVHYFAVLIGVGATTINAYLAQESIADRYSRGLFEDVSYEELCRKYKKSVDAGLLKVLSKMGISVISSYRGAYNFEALGLSRALVREFFPGMHSRISGIGLSGIKKRVLLQHKKAFENTGNILPMGGFYKSRATGEVHAFEGRLIHTLQSAVEKDSYTTYKKYSQGVYAMPLVNVRDLLDFKTDRSPIAIEEVESITEIRKRFMSGSMSLGALSREAHENLAIAMNRIGASSCSGEGGESKERFQPRENGDNANSAVKQIASGRFGVTAEYLNSCKEIEIKMAQGAKPGEGGQLPGFKVTSEIAKLRHATPGVTLISPPPHHDIYSIEDLAQLIYDLKQINPQARVSVKLVAEAGIGTVAAGVAKAKSDIILVSGNDGGTGASPQSSLKYAGVPWELGLAEVNQVLTLNGLRHITTLRADGGLKTGRDVVIAAMLGAEEFGIGTAALVAMGCIMVRQCHSNTCPVGICTQDEKLRSKFEGTPEKVVNLYTFIAEEVREILASLGYTKLEEIIGRPDLLNQISRGSSDLDDLDLNPILSLADSYGKPRFSSRIGRHEVPGTLDDQMINDAQGALETREKTQLAYTIRNTHRSVGTRLSSELTRRFGMRGLPSDHFTIRLRGSAGQSLGAFAVQGLKIIITGDANDYVGKGLSGGTIVVSLATSSKLVSNKNTIIGNTVLYGATSGKLFAAGQAGERFCVRNSGADAVVEGCGSNGCEYMTGGLSIILGSVGDNFAAGMTGGMAFVYDKEGKFESKVNKETVTWQRMNSNYWENICKNLVHEHFLECGSRFSEDLIVNWDLEVGNFWQICPKEMIDKLEFPLNSHEPIVSQAV
tara:strand:+ start:32903 stop:37453 length:4551 start_codon:yes stop_codon:yes gene_type:complete